MRELDFFLGADETDGVLTDHVAAARHGKADRAGHARAGLTLARVDGQLGELAAARRGDTLTQSERGARRGVDLVPMVRLRDLDVVAVARAPSRRAPTSSMKTLTPTLMLRA